MKEIDKKLQAFFALIRAGLLEKGVKLQQYGIADFTDFYALAEKQSVLGLVAAALEHVEDMKLPQNVALTLVGSALKLEQRNQTMNEFVAELIWSLRREGVMPF